MSLTRKYILFFAPIAAILALPVFCLMRSGEALSIHRIVDIQRSSHGQGLVGLAYSNRDGLYKLESAKRARPQVLVLGSSRTTQFRENLVPGKKFYNASRSFARLEDLNLFAQNLFSEAVPEEIILGLDAYFFRPGWSMEAEAMHYADERPVVDALKILFVSWPRFYQDVWDRKISLKEIANVRDRKSIGMNAWMKGRGFRTDGSYENGEDFRSTALEDRLIGATRDLESGGYYFRGADSVDWKAYKELEKFLILCRIRGVRVAGFLPPHAHAIYERLKERRGDLGYYFELPERLKHLFEAYGFKFYDFGDVQTLSMPDEVMMDGFHGSEDVAKAIFDKIS